MGKKNVSNSEISKKKEVLNSFYETIKQAGEVLSTEELDVAIEALKLTGLEIKQKEERRRREEEAKLAEERRQEELRRREEAMKLLEEKRLQHVAEVTAMDLPMDWVNSYDADERTETKADSVADGLMMSLDLLGMVDIEFIASVTGEEYKTVINKLKGSIYQNPLFWEECFYKGWETADEYLSGNLMHKYQIAKDANAEYAGYFEANIKALEELIVPEISVNDIYVTLGSPWVPTDVIDEFILHLIGEDPVNGTYSPEMQEYFGEEYAVRHDEITGIWEIPNKTRFRKSKHHGLYEELNYSVFGTQRMDMLYLLENILNMKTVSVSDARDVAGKVRVINKTETVKLLEKQEKMISEFRSWVWTDPPRKSRLQSAYCRKYGNIRQRKFDGSFLEFPGMNKDIELYPYQKDAVARILFSPNTLLAHEVGAGKTYVMIAAGMELKRLGKSEKNLYVVPNNILGQWRDLFHQMYPQASVFVVDNNNFNAKKRNETLRRIIDEKHDAILMTYSCFDMLSLSKKYYQEMYARHLELLEQATKTFYSQNKLGKKKAAIVKTLDMLQQESTKHVCDIAFDDLGINTLFVDEAHNYKNVGVESGITRVLGAGGRCSDKAKGMMDKVHCVQRNNNGGRVIFATGTPITNSITDIFVMQKYLQEGELEFLGIQNFDSWAGMFAEKRTDFEIDVDTNSYHLTTRFSKFCNIPELTSILSSIADYHHVDKRAGLPEFEGYEDSLREGSEDFKEYLMDISNRADDVRQKRVKCFEDNLLKITSDGRKAALDMRLIDLAYGLDPDSKVMRCAENILEVYEETKEMKGVQIVFCDSSTPKRSFNLYRELKKILTAMGIPQRQIAFIHDAVTEKDREELFQELRAGSISVVVGSTFKLGHGVNIQEKLSALHHLDVPWRPADMVQREGRILRQGNLNPSVRIFRYITKASFDAYSWQLLENKQRFISQILSGHTTEREGNDVDESVLNYAEVKALAVGNPLIKKRVEISNELDKYRILQRDYMEDRSNKTQELQMIPQKIQQQKMLIELCKRDINECAEDKTEYEEIPYLKQKEIRETIYRAARTKINLPFETNVIEYRGFQVSVPAYMVPRKPTGKTEGQTKNTLIPYVYLKRNGTYRMEIESESGITKRLNNFFHRRKVMHRDKKTKNISSIEYLPSGLELKLEEYQDSLSDLKTREKVLKEELKKQVGYEKQIQTLQEALDKIDEELGVKIA